MKANDIREMNPDELSDELENLQKKFFEIRTQAVTEKLEDPTQLTKVKRDIARIMTVIREQQIAEQAQPDTEQPEKP